GGIGHYGNCLAGTERLAFLNDGHLFDLTIQDFADRYGTREPSSVVSPNHPVHVLSVDPLSGRAVWRPIRRIFRRESDQLLRIRTALGRCLRLTPDHPAIVVREGRWEVVSAQSLRQGDLLPLSKHLPLTDDSRPQSIDLIECLRGVRNDLYAELPAAIEIPAKMIPLWRELVPEAWRRHEYATTGRMRLDVFLALEAALGVS